jgi:UDP-N-acetylglucosamine/UDP-N-acetylgalactosamine diphosphorylase
MKDELLKLLSPHGQQHLLAYWDELSTTERSQLTSQIRQLDLDLITGLCASLKEKGTEEIDWRALAARAEPPPAVQLAEEDEDAVRAAGEAALRAGRVGMILVAGGQGTRLGFDHPKGLFTIGPLSGRTLFQVFIDRLRAVARRYDVRIPLFLMTSPATHDETVAYFAEQNSFGLGKQDMRIFCQGVMPAVDAQSGRLLMSSPASLSLSPDGHGGMLAAFDGSGCMELARERGIDVLFYGQVDNPLLQVCEPSLLGCHLTSESEMTTQVVRKVDPEEKVGNVVQIDGRTRTIEYSDLPTEIAGQRNPDGTLRLWAGNLAVHIFDRAFLERMVGEDGHLPFHQALKKSDFVDDQGHLIRPTEPNSIKFEKFIFDLMPAARRAAVVESAKEVAFAPVKNADGAPTDTPRSAKRAMMHRDLQVLEAAGIQVAKGVSVEINPLWALDAREAADKIEPGTTITEPTYFS